MWSFTGLGLGKVLFWDPTQGFGFIENGCSGTRRGVFFWFRRCDGVKTVIDPMRYEVIFTDRAVSRDPKPGDSIIFEMGEDKKGPWARRWIFCDDFVAKRDVLPEYRVIKVVPGRPDEVVQSWVNICRLNTSKELHALRHAEHHQIQLGFVLQWQTRPSLRLSGRENGDSEAGWVNCDDPRVTPIHAR